MPVFPSFLIKPPWFKTKASEHPTTMSVMEEEELEELEECEVEELDELEEHQRLKQSTGPFYLC